MTNAKYMREYRQTPSGKLAHRKLELKRKHGITPEDYEQMLEKQLGECAICKTDSPGRYDVFRVDHCHVSGKIRGLLCDACNRGIGLLKENTTTLAQAIKYLGGT